MDATGLAMSFYGWQAGHLLASKKVLRYQDAEKETTSQI
jgi:hypothetical protein